MRPLVDERGRVRAAVLQMTTTEDMETNIATALRLIDEAAACGACLVVLPEKFHYLGAVEGVAGAKESLDGLLLARLAEEANRHQVYLVAGSVWESVPGDVHTYNTSVLLGPDGSRLAAYRKLHMFDVDVGGRGYRESETCLPGDEVVAVTVPSDWVAGGVPGTALGTAGDAPADLPAGAGGAGEGEAIPIAAGGVTVGLTVCYDLRFPELYRALADMGALIVTAPAAFTMTTGRDHWHVLVRARAIENQVYMVAANQSGCHGPGLESYGRSIIVDPWGVVLAQAPDGEGVAVADLDMVRLEQVRASLPAPRNRAPDAYGRRRMVDVSGREP
jgi:predicted amidohydrolase